MNQTDKLKQIRKTVKYEVHSGIKTNDALFKGIILKSLETRASNTNQCYLIDEDNKEIHHLPTRPEGFINKESGLTISFTEEKDINKLIHTLIHYCIIWFDEPKTLLQITNEMLI